MCVGQPFSLTPSSLLSLSHLSSPFPPPSLLPFSLLTLLDRKGMDSPWRVWEISESNFQASEVSRKSYRHPLVCSFRPISMRELGGPLLTIPPSLPECPHDLPTQNHLPCLSSFYKCFFRLFFFLNECVLLTPIWLCHLWVWYPQRIGGLLDPLELVL